jgi:hypothetical protein
MLMLSMSAPRTSFSFIEQHLLYELDRDLARIPKRFFVQRGKRIAIRP